MVKLYHCLVETILNELVGTLLYSKAYTSSYTGTLYSNVIWNGSISEVAIGRVGLSVTLQHLDVTVAALDTCATWPGLFQGAGGH